LAPRIDILPPSVHPIHISARVAKQLTERNPRRARSKEIDKAFQGFSDVESVFTKAFGFKSEGGAFVEGVKWSNEPFEVLTLKKLHESHAKPFQSDAREAENRRGEHEKIEMLSQP
jgi:hypothetical protein